MKTLTVSALAVIAGLGMLAAATTASATTIIDNYWGATAHGEGDVIGHDGLFDIKSADITRHGDVLTVVIHSNFGPNSGGTSGHGGLGTYKSLSRDGNGIGFGDLFLATTWNPAGSAANHYQSDDASSGTVWSYGLALDNRWSMIGGNAALYALNGPSNADNILDSDHFIKSNAVYRNGQEVAVKTTTQRRHRQPQPNGNVHDTGNTGTWLITDNASSPWFDITFNVDVGGTALATADDIAMRWEVTCANDVIEGIATMPKVPEPSPFVLLAGGLLLIIGTGWRHRHGGKSRQR